MASLAACGDVVGSADDTPGFRESASTLDTRPFKLAEPARSGIPTTIPGFNDRATTSTSTSTTTAPPPPPTTVKLPDLPRVLAGDLECQALLRLGTLFRSSAVLEKEPERLAVAASTAFRQAAQLLREADLARYLDVINELERRAGELDRATTFDEVASIVEPVTTLSEPWMRKAAQPLLDHAARNCPGLTSGR